MESMRYTSKYKKGIRRGVKELTPECDPDESHEQFTTQERERGWKVKEREKMKRWYQNEKNNRLKKKD